MQFDDSDSSDDDMYEIISFNHEIPYTLTFQESSLGLQITQNLLTGGVYVSSTDGMRSDRDDDVRSKIVLGDFIVKDSVGITTFSVLDEVSASANRVLKHGFNANDFSSGIDGENLGSRSLTFYDNQSAILINDVTTDSVAGVSTFAISAFCVPRYARIAEISLVPEPVRVLLATLIISLLT